MLGFLGFPIGGLLAMSTVGAIDTSAAALIGGALTGAVLGVAQSLGSPALPRAAWIAATTIGLSAGLTIGTTAVDFGTSLGDLAAQGVGVRCADRSSLRPPSSPARRHSAAH